MARRPLGYRTRRSQQIKVLSRPAPIGGLNARDALGAMPAMDAYLLDNWFPQQDGLVTRNGSASHATGLGGTVETLAVYAGADGNELLGFANGSIFNCTAAGAVGAAITTGRTNNKIVTAMFSNAGGQRLIGVNGVDEPFEYDGSTYGGLTITGVTGTQNNLAYVHAHKNRLYFAAVEELGFYYLASEAIEGAATYFDLAQIFRKGGYLMSIGSFTQSMGSGPDDLIFFLSSEGEIAVYQGTDPGNANAWSIVGTYVIGKPFGRKCIGKYGGDSLVITDMGLLPVSTLFQRDDPSPTEDALSAKLGRTLQQHNQFRSTYGWHICIHPANTMLIMNAPYDTRFYQFVMNTVTGAWTRFSGWEAYSFAEIDGELYFGAASGVVYQADTGFDDSGTAIRANAKQAYDRFNEPQLKHWLNARVKAEYAGSPPISVAFNVDYVENVPDYASESTTSGAGYWDESDWDTTSWSTGGDVISQWVDINQAGFTGAMWLRSETEFENLKWFETDYLYKLGGPV
jgi:hypothetical protein